MPTAARESQKDAAASIAILKSLTYARHRRIARLESLPAQRKMVATSSMPASICACAYYGTYRLLAQDCHYHVSHADETHAHTRATYDISCRQPIMTFLLRHEAASHLRQAMRHAQYTLLSLSAL